MAIRLDVADYCQECTDFRAEVKNAEKMYAGINDYILTNTVITCKDKDRCKNLARYLETRMRTKEIDKNDSI